MSFLRNILIVGLFSNGIYTGFKVVDLDFALAVGSNGLIYAITDNSELNAINLSVFGSFNNLCATIADLNIEESLYRVTNRSGIGYGILNAAGTMLTIRPYDNAGTGIALGRSNRNLICRSILSGNRQFISTNAEFNTCNIRRERVLGQNTV